MVGIRVTKTDGLRRLNFFAATVRTVVKFILGWFSFIFVLTTTKHQAIHDLVVHSVVTHRNVAELPAYEVLTERRVESEEFIYPSKWKRALIVVSYWVVMSIALAAGIGFLLSEGCATSSRCTTLDSLLSIALELVWLVSTGVVIVLGWSGRLPGARRQIKLSRGSAT
jgi:uncharacterized RDD family membrane protein YckC